MFLVGISITRRSVPKVGPQANAAVAMPAWRVQLKQHHEDISLGRVLGECEAFGEESHERWTHTLLNGPARKVWPCCKAARVRQLWPVH